MRLKELRGLPVIDPTTARKIGTIADYQLDPASARLAAVDVTSSGTGDGQRILATRIRRVGRSAVILTAGGGPLADSKPEVDDRWLDESTLVGLEVMGEDGIRVGRLLDAIFDQNSLEISAYLLRTRPWQQLTGNRGRIQPTAVQACSRELMLLGSAAAQDVTTSATGGQESTTVVVHVPLKTEDRASAPAFEQVSDGQTVGARSR